MLWMFVIIQMRETENLSIPCTGLALQMATSHYAKYGHRVIYKIQLQIWFAI